MTINLFKEFGARCWYCGEPKPVHQKFSDCEINACRSCIRLGGKDGLEEFRMLLGERTAHEANLKTRSSRHLVRTKGQSRTVKELFWRTSPNCQGYTFYFEELAIDFSCEMESVDNRIWHQTTILSAPKLLTELGSKCWYCGKLLCRHKEEWREVRIPLGHGEYVEGRELDKVTPYHGRPTHDRVDGFTVNACRSCTSRRHRKPIEEYRGWLGVRVMRESQELQNLQVTLVNGMARTDEERQSAEERVQQLRAIGEGYMFYVEELIFRCGRAWSAQNYRF